MFDYIPPGKKQVRDEQGNWSLVDLNEREQDDAVILLQEAKTYIAKLELQIKELTEPSEPKKKK